MKNIKIMVATHKAYRMPKDEIYLPVHVGREGKTGIGLGFCGDNSGDNISLKNPYFCELTALYWGWKNLNADYIGLAHYRRHFKNSKHKSSNRWLNILSGEQARTIFKDYDIIVPNKRRYFIETNYSHYVHAHERAGIDLLVDIIKREYPTYERACESVLKRTHAHMFNMFIMKKDSFDAYCSWLFEILFKIEKRVDTSSYNEYERRVFGFLSELMLDIWLVANKKSYYECPVMFMERQNWLIKGGAFLRRKVFGK